MNEAEARREVWTPTEGGARSGEVATPHRRLSEPIRWRPHCADVARSEVSSHVTTHPPSAALLTRSGAHTRPNALHQPARHRRRQVGRRRPAARVGVGEPGTRGVPGSELRGVLLCSSAPPSAANARTARRAARRAAAAPVGDHLRLLAVGERELAVGRQRLPVHVALRVDRHELELDLAARRLVAQQPGRRGHVGYSPSDVSIRMPRRGSQQPSCGRLPTMYTCSPNTVFARPRSDAHEEHMRRRTVRRLARQLELRAERGRRARARERESREDDMVASGRLQGSIGLSALAREHSEEMDFRRLRPRRGDSRRALAADVARRCVTRCCARAVSRTRSRTSRSKATASPRRSGCCKTRTCTRS